MTEIVVKIGTWFLDAYIVSEITGYSFQSFKLPFLDFTKAELNG